MALGCLIPLIVGALIGLLVFMALGTAHAGGDPEVGGSLLLVRDKETVYHMHHWTYLLPLLVVIWLVVWLGKGEATGAMMLLSGFLVGGSLQDMRYRDWDVIVKHAPWRTSE